MVASHSPSSSVVVTVTSTSKPAPEVAAAGAEPVIVTSELLPAGLAKLLASVTQLLIVPLKAEEPLFINPYQLGVLAPPPLASAVLNAPSI